MARRLLANLAYQSESLSHTLAESKVLLATERADPGWIRRQIEVAFANLEAAPVSEQLLAHTCSQKMFFRLGQKLATTLSGIVMRIVPR